MNPDNVFTHEEQMLMSIYDPGNGRAALIAELETMRGYLDADENELRELTDSTLGKLENMTDTEFDAIVFVPDIDI